MISNHTNHIAERAKAIYGRQLQAELEAAHPGRYVAIEPESGENYLADSFEKAVAAARAAHPNCISFVVRIGHPAAIHLGGLKSRSSAIVTGQTLQVYDGRSGVRKSSRSRLGK